MSLAAGELNRKIIVSKRMAGVDSLNQPVDVWVPVFPDGLWSKVLGVTGMTVVRAALDGVPVAPGRYSFRIRFRLTGITTAMRVEYGGMNFDIIEIRHDMDRHEFTDLVCNTGGSNG